MSTTSDSRQEKREEKLERYIELEAIAVFLQNLRSLVPEGETEPDTFERADWLGGEITGEEVHELWPDAEARSEPSQERAFTDIRAELKTAQMFAAFAAHPELARKTADYFTDLAEHHAADLQTRIELRREADGWRHPEVLRLTEQLREYMQGEGGRRRYRAAREEA